jgi:transposase
MRVYSELMNDTTPTPPNTPPDWRDDRIAALESELAKERAINQALHDRVQQLEADVAALKRAGKRQAVPFARRAHVAEPKRPGRKAGQGVFAHRAQPEPEQVHETHDTPLAGCPECGGALTDFKDHAQFVVDIPPVQPVVTRYVTHSGYCVVCGKRVRSHHPAQISDATGAAGVMVGPRAKALAANLKHRLGASYAKVCEVLNDAFGLKVTRSGWCHADRRLVQHARPVYVELIDVLRECAVAHRPVVGGVVGVHESTDHGVHHSSQPGA